MKHTKKIKVDVTAVKCCIFKENVHGVNLGGSAPSGYMLGDFYNEYRRIK